MKKQDAIDHFGGVVQLAYALRCSPQAISQWGKTIPQGRAYQIEVLTGGELRADPAAPSGQQRQYQRVAPSTPLAELPSVKRAAAAKEQAEKE